jgi:hypothetical protein
MLGRLQDGAALERVMRWWFLLALGACATSAAAHDIYMRADLYACCHDHDCRVAEPDEVLAQDDGSYLVVPTHERFTRAEVKASPDTRVHRCLYEKNNIRSRTRCILVPTAS